MADWYGTMRSNYFRVMDRERFEEWLATFPDLKLITEKDAEGVEMVGFYDEHGSGTVPCSANRWYDDSDQTWIKQPPPSAKVIGNLYEDYIDVEFCDELAEHLAKGSCCVIVESGAEKARYVTGVAIAITCEGFLERISISDIYDKVKERDDTLECTEAEY